MAQVQLGGRPVAVEDTGGDGPPLVWSTGPEVTARELAPRLARLAPTHRVLVWDAIEAGTTGEVGWREAHDLLALLDALGIERAILAGERRGGQVALRATLVAPDRVRALVLAATGIPAPDPDHLGDRVPEIDAPTLLVRGEVEPGLTSDQLAPLRDGLSDLRGEVVVPVTARPGHITGEDVVAHALRDFLAGLPA